MIIIYNIDHFLGYWERGGGRIQAFQDLLLSLAYMLIAVSFSLLLRDIHNSDGELYYIVQQICENQSSHCLLCKVLWSSILFIVSQQRSLYCELSVTTVASNQIMLQQSVLGSSSRNPKPLLCVESNLFYKSVTFSKTASFLDIFLCILVFDFFPPLCCTSLIC